MHYQGCLDPKSKCPRVGFGTYENTVVLELPWKDRVENIDICILEEILWLWILGVMTTYSCCGHGRNIPHIGKIT